jgi:ankyrin repeat protein
MKKGILLSILIICLTIPSISQLDSLDTELFKTNVYYYSYYNFRNYWKVQDLIKEGADVNAQKSDGNTLLHFAARNNNRDLTKLLLYLNARTDIKNNKGKTPLDLASERRSSETKDILLNPAFDAYFYAKYGSFSQLKEALKNNPDQLHKPDKFGFTILDYAVCRHKDGEEIVQYLIDQGVDLNFSYIKVLDIAIQNDNIEIARLYSAQDTLKKYVRPLNVAIKEKNFEMVKLLVDNGIDVNGKDYLDYKPIEYAMQSDYKDNRIILYLIKAGVDKDYISWDKRNLLHLLCQYGSDETSENNEDIVILKVLLEKGLDLNSTDEYGKMPIHYAAENKFGLQLIDFITSYSEESINSKDGEGNTALDIAIMNNTIETATLLITKGTDLKKINNNGNTSLHSACRYQPSVELIKLLIANGIEINKQNNKNETALHLAIKNNAGKEVISYLIEKGADVNIKDKKNNSALMFAVQNKKPKLVKQLIDAGSDVNVQNNNAETPLKIALHRSSAEIVQILLQNGASPEGIDLSDAVLHNNLKLTNLILSSGADPNSTNDNGRSPLIIASSRGYKEILTSLLNAGANINISDIHFKSALHAALSNNHYECAKILINKGIDIKTRKAHITPLHLAAQNKDAYEIVALLINNGANVHALDHTKLTPLNYALKEDNRQNAELLKQSIRDQKKKKVKKNALLPDRQIFYDIVPFSEDYYSFEDNSVYSQFYNNLEIQTENIGQYDIRKDFVNKSVNGSLSSFEEYAPNISDLEKENMFFKSYTKEEITERLGGGEDEIYMIDEYTGEALGYLIYEEPDPYELEGMVFYDNWYFDKANFEFKKDVTAYGFIRKYYIDEDWDYAEPRFKICSYIPYDLSAKEKKKLRKKSSLFKRVKYECLLNNRETYFIDPMNEYFYNFNPSSYEKEESPYWTKHAKEIIIDEILQKVLSEQIDAYDYHSGEKIEVNDIYHRLGAIPDSIYLEDPETWELYLEIVQRDIQTDEIQSLIFIEDWYVDPESMYISKEIIGIAPVRRYYEMTDIEGYELNKTIPFVIYFNEIPKDVYNERKITINTIISDDAVSLQSYFNRDSYYHSVNNKEINFNSLYFNSAKSGKIQLYSPDIIEDPFANYNTSNYLAIDTTEFLKNMGIYNDTLVVFEPESFEEKTIIHRTEGYGLDSLTVLHFYETWNFDLSEFTFKKDVFSYSPGIRFYRDEDLEQENPVYKLTGYVLNDNNIPTDKMELLKKIKYEYFIEDPTDEEFEIIPNIEENKALFPSSYNKKKFKDELFELVTTGTVKAYDFHNGQKLSNEEINERLKIYSDTVLLMDVETGELFEALDEKITGSEDIKSFVFLENWYLDSKSLSIKKDVIGIAPVVYYEDRRNDDDYVIRRKILFTLYFDESNKF